MPDLPRRRSRLLDSGGRSGRVRSDAACPSASGAARIGITWPGARPHDNTFRGHLQRLGVLGDKHVPEAYLAAGTGQRLALLQGLLDTDGTIHHRSGQVAIVQKRQPVAEAVAFLVRSLGWRASVREAGRG